MSWCRLADHYVEEGQPCNDAYQEMCDGHDCTYFANHSEDRYVAIDDGPDDEYGDEGRWCILDREEDRVIEYHDDEDEAVERAFTLEEGRTKAL